MYADFSLAGIFRSAYVFSVPSIHLGRVQSHTQFDSAYKNPVLVTNITVVNESASPASGAKLELKLISSDHAKLVASAPILLDLPAWRAIQRQLRIEVSSPLRWTAEHPNLYTLAVVIESGSGD